MEQPVTINVYFRKFPEGDVIALWDEGDLTPWISSYMHVGQHGEASADLVDSLDKATSEEYADLMKEMQGRGYEINVMGE